MRVRRGLADSEIMVGVLCGGPRGVERMGGLPTTRREQYWTDLSIDRGASSERQEG